MPSPCTSPQVGTADLTLPADRACVRASDAVTTESKGSVKYAWLRCVCCLRAYLLAVHDFNSWLLQWTTWAPA